MVTPLVRPAMTELVKLFIILSRKVAVVAEEVKEDLEDVTAEARAGADSANETADEPPESAEPPGADANSN